MYIRLYDDFFYLFFMVIFTQIGISLKNGLWPLVEYLYFAFEGVFFFLAITMQLILTK